MPPLLGLRPNGPSRAGASAATATAHGRGAQDPGSIPHHERARAGRAQPAAEEVQVTRAGTLGVGGSRLSAAATQAASRSPRTAAAGQAVAASLADGTGGLRVGRAPGQTRTTRAAAREPTRASAAGRVPAERRVWVRRERQPRGHENLGGRIDEHWQPLLRRDGAERQGGSPTPWGAPPWLRHSGGARARRRRPLQQPCDSELERLRPGGPGQLATV